jgi:hypothetical protein
MVSAALGGGPLGEAVGTQVGAAVIALVTNPTIGAGLSALVDTIFTDFFGATGVVPAFATAADNLVVAVLGGQDVEAAIAAALAGLQANGDIQAAVDLTVSAGVAEVLSNTAMWQAISGIVGSLVSGLLADATVDQALNTQIASTVSALLGGGALGETVGGQVAAAAMALITSPAVTNALAEAVTSGISSLVGAAGVISAISDAAGQFAVDVLTGDGIDAALATMLASLEANPTIIAGLESAITAGLDVVNTQLLSNPEVQQLLSTTVSTLFLQLTSDPVVRTAIANFVGAPYGQIIANLLANPSVTADFAQVLGTAITDFLSFPGFNSALIAAVDEVAVAVLTGTELSVALREGLASLQADPAFTAAVDAIVPGLVNEIVSNSAVRQAMGEAAQQLIIAMLENAGITNGLLDGVVGQVVKGTVTALMAQPAMADLLSTMGIKVLQGMPLSDITSLFVQAVLNEPAMQGAVGISLGYGIGSLFGANIVGDLVGFAAGTAATITISILAGLVRTFQTMFPSAGTGLVQSQSTALVSPNAAHNNVFAAADGSYAMSSIVADQAGVEALGRGLTTDGGLTLSDVALTGLTDAGSEFVDVTLTIAATSTEADAAERSPLVVASRFSLDWLLQQMESPVATAGIRRQTADVAP